MENELQFRPYQLSSEGNLFTQNDQKKSPNISF